MVGKKKNERVQMWVPISFKSYLYQEKSRNPKKNFLDIMDDIAKEKDNRNENKSIFPKW